MKKILCPTDFSETAHNAIAYAAKLAKTMNAELTLLNVQSLLDLTAVELVRGKELTLEAASENLEAQSREVTKTFKISCYPEVEPSISKLSSAISRKGQDYDLIVMGTNGADDLYKFFAGSNTYNAILKSETSVLLIPTEYVYTEISRITYAFDYLHERNLPMTRLIKFIKALNCKLNVLQILNEEPKEVENDLDELQLSIKKFYSGDVEFTYETIRGHEVAQSINSYVLKNQPEALALCSMHRNLMTRLFHKSVIKYISAICSYPVFVFHQ